jgi:hypothetical protein
MFGAISRRLVTGGALLLATFLAADAAEIDDDLPDLADQIAQMAAEVALELQQVCPPASPSDQAAFDRCRRSLFGDSALRRSLAPRLLWGRRNQDAGAALKNTNLTQFAPDVIAGLYLSLFMYSGEYSTEYVERERLYLIRLRAGFRNLLPPGQFPYPFWHEEAKWDVYQAANESDAFCRVLEQQKINATFLVPTIIYTLLDDSAVRSRYDLSSLETIVYGAAPMSPHRIEQGVKVFGLVFVQMYGQTESPQCIMTLRKEVMIFRNHIVLDPAGDQPRPLP